jgi:hypothetical protein
MQIKNETTGPIKHECINDSNHFLNTKALARPFGTPQTKGGRFAENATFNANSNPTKPIVYANAQTNSKVVFALEPSLKTQTTRQSVQATPRPSDTRWLYWSRSSRQ